MDIKTNILILKRNFSKKNKLKTEAFCIISTSPD